MLESNRVYEQRNAESVIWDRFKKSLSVTQKKLYESLTVTETVKRGFLVKRDVPYVIKNVVALS